MPRAGFKRGSSSGNLLDLDNDALNRLATTTGKNLLLFSRSRSGRNFVVHSNPIVVSALQYRVISIGARMHHFYTNLAVSPNFKFRPFSLYELIFLPLES